MYRSILVPLDGSAAAEHALPMAVSLARRFAAALEIIHVHAPAWGVYGEGGVYDALVDREIREGMQAYLDGIVQRISSDTGISVTSTLLDGLVPDEIRRHAMESNSDLVVMITQGRGPVARFWLGSVADRLVRQLTIPILFVRPQEGDADFTQEPKFERMLIPLDGSQLAEQILEPATAIASATNAEVTLLRVVQPWTPPSYPASSGRVGGIHPAILAELQEADRREQQRAAEYLQQLARKLRTRSLTVQSRVVSHARPATAILDDVSAPGTDLVAVATHGRGGLKRLLIGSVADKVLRGATTPVLVYRPVDEYNSEEDEST